MRHIIGIFMVFAFIVNSNGQHLNHDIGISAGIASLQADYGQRGDFASTYLNRDLSISLSHYLSFYNTNTRWNARGGFINRFMFRTELNYTTISELENFGEFVEGTTPEAERLREMKGSVYMFQFGVNAEFFLRDIADFAPPNSTYKFNPYVSFGLKYVYYENSLESTLGDWRTDISVLPKKYTEPGAINIGPGSTFALNLSTGFRYKITERIDFTGRFGIQLFLSDEIDGLNTDLDSNRFNETLVSYHAGIVYHLNFFRPLFR